jgi:hypothetical protein
MRKFGKVIAMHRNEVDALRMKCVGLAEALSTKANSLRLEQLLTSHQNLKLEVVRFQVRRAGWYLAYAH